VTLVNYGDNSLLGAEPNGINNYGIDEPDLFGRPSRTESQSPQWATLFQSLQFSENASGHAGHRQAALFLRTGNG
jgi:hypothetical protein